MTFSGPRVMNPAALCPCKSGRAVSDCHDNLARAPGREEFYDTIETGIAMCTLLPSHLPRGYPRGGRFAVGYERALSFEWERTKEYRHSINLPLLLSVLGNPRALDNVRQYAAGTLEVIERFILEFPELPVATVLKPLWQEVFDTQPRFWSVLAHCHIAIFIKRVGHSVVGFEVPTGHGQSRADIHYRTAEGMDILLDLEMWNAPRGTTAESIRCRLRSRAIDKAARKFGALPPGTSAVVTQVAMPDDGVLGILRSHQAELMTPFEISPNLRVELVAFASVGDEQGRQIGLDFLTFQSQLRPLRPTRS